MTRLIIVTVSLACAAGVAAPASAQRVKLEPYIEANQVFAADLNGGGDVLTYTSVDAGIDASINTRRVEVQVSYRYERRFGYEKPISNDEIHSGLAKAKIAVTPGFSLEAGAIATRSRNDIRGDASVSNQGNVRNTSQVYSGYVGPNLATHVGPVFANAAYRFGYTKVEAKGPTGVDPGQPALDTYDDSTVHVATASVGVKSGTVLPVGLTASASYTRENAGQLDQRFESKFLRGDVVLPVGRGIAVAAGVGAEQVQVSQRDPLRTGTGAPVTDSQGRFVTAPGSPRRLAYDFDGIFWDAGVIWRPSKRTFLEARVGRRYDSMSYTGSFSYQIGPGSGIQLGAYDSVQTFGSQLNAQVAALPASFVDNTDPFGNQYSGCVYGSTGAAAGGCLNGVFASSATSAYRSRGLTGVAVLNRGSTRIGIGGGYSRRDFLAPGGGTSFSTNGITDESVYTQLFASTDVGANGALSGSLLGSYYDTEIAGNDPIYGWGANTAYTHRFGKLGAMVSAGVYGFERDGGSSASAQGMVGLRYGFR